MIPISIINQVNHCPEKEIYRFLENYDKSELETTRQELLEFRNEKNQLIYLNVFNCIENILNDRIPEEVKLE